MIDYKPSVGGKETFSNVNRQNLYTGTDDVAFDVRCFECARDGYTTLEKHEHVHVVMILRGQGKMIVGDEVLDVVPYDLVVIPSMTAHQLVNTGDEPFGFTCLICFQKTFAQM